MTNPGRLRDSTQIVAPSDTLEEFRADLQERFTVTIHEAGEHLRIIGSPVEIREASDFLSRQGVALP